ncbi:MAG TPA: hypothetical protein VFD90_13950 [Gaiellales bacterium]|nr:hypothetical protein [Gaiellales bacterium]
MRELHFRWLDTPCEPLVVDEMPTPEPPPHPQPTDPPPTAVLSGVLGEDEEEQRV